MANLDPAERRPRTDRAQHLAQAGFLSDQDDVHAARSDGGKDSFNLDTRGPVGAHRIDGNPDLVQVLSTSLMSTTMRSL